MGCPRRLFAAAALWLVTSSQRARPRRDLGASSAATSGQRYKPQRVATYAGPRLGDTVNRSASPLPRPWSACERCGVVTTINPPSEAILRVGNASGWCLVVAGDGRPPTALTRACAAPATVAYLSAAAQETLPYGLASATPWDHFARKNLGYLYAIHAGAATIFDFDDDNVLLGAAGLGRHGGTKLDTREKRTLPQPLTRQGQGRSAQDAEIAGLREGSPRSRATAAT
ncbi:hypothetical protein JL722_10781 [Aureococcus anophagefferens]|nr:hypothetical protein JL722_10781 [Aureococcus anophagefferens]